MQHTTLTQTAALAGAVAVLRDLADGECELTPTGGCTRHGWTGADPCPQLRLRVLLDGLGGHPAAPVYRPETLRALLRGLAAGQEVRVTVRVNGYAHQGRLLGGFRRGASLDSFRVRLDCGEVIEQVPSADVLELDVRASTSEVWR